MIDNYVTGASGFIGKHLMAKLTGNTVAIQCHGIPGVEVSEKFFFLSTYGNMVSHTSHGEMIQANVLDLMKIMYSPKWLCYMSSSSVTLPVQTPYSRTKRAAEEILQALPELKSCIVRPYSVFGRNEQKEHLIPTLIRSCVNGELMDFSPWPTHDWIAVDDVVDALVLFSERGATGIYELGTGASRSNQEVLEAVQDATGRKANIRRVNSLRPYDNKEWVCDSFIAGRKLGWTPKRDFVTTIQEMVDQYVKELPSL